MLTFTLLKTLKSARQKLTGLFDFASTKEELAVQRPDLRAVAELLSRLLELLLGFLATNVSAMNSHDD